MHKEDHPNINETYCKHHYGMWQHECGCDIIPRKRKISMVNEDKIKALKSKLDIAVNALNEIVDGHLAPSSYNGYLDEAFQFIAREALKQIKQE